MQQQNKDTDMFYGGLKQSEHVLDLSQNQNTDQLLEDMYSSVSSATQKAVEKERVPLHDIVDHTVDKVASSLFQTWLRRSVIWKRSLDIAKYATLSASLFALLFGITNFESYYIQAQYAWDEYRGNLNTEHFMANISEEFNNHKEKYTTKSVTRRSLPQAKEGEILPGSIPEIGFEPELPGILSVSAIDFDPLSTESRIVIPRIRVNAPISWGQGQDEQSMLESLESGVAHFPGTSLPGQYGNFFLTGHSSYYAWAAGAYKSVFALLHKLEHDDIVHIWHEGVEYKYRIFDTFVVTPDNLDVLDHIPGEKNLTLMTCTPIGTNKNRLIHRAELIE